MLPPLLTLSYPWAADTLDSTIFIFWSASPLVSGIAWSMRVHELGGRGSEGALKRGVYLFVPSSSNVNNLSPELFTPSLNGGVTLSEGGQGLDTRPVLLHLGMVYKLFQFEAQNHTCHL